MKRVNGCHKLPPLIDLLVADLIAARDPLAGTGFTRPVNSTEVKFMATNRAADKAHRRTALPIINVRITASWNPVCGNRADTTQATVQ